MKYTIDNKTIDIPDELIKEYEKNGKTFKTRKIKIMYQNAKLNQKQNIEEDIIAQIKADIKMQNDFPDIISKLPQKGIKL